MQKIPNAKNAEIPKEKLTEYALNPLKEPNKALAFEKALGYTIFNVNKLIENIKSNIENFNAIDKGDNGWGHRYEILMTITGPNGKTANIITAWIIDNDKDFPRLTSTYITKRKVNHEH
jgi:hypothetical protein